jgi:major membrane immunogen (membrane-anchored lipoprotein)
MKYKYMVLIAITALLLSACGNNEKSSGSVNDGEPSSESNALEHGITDKSEVGFEMAGGKIEEAQGVPKDERKSILAAFDTYMTAFNKEDIDSYMSVIAKDPEDSITMRKKRLLKRRLPNIK